MTILFDRFWAFSPLALQVLVSPVTLAFSVVSPHRRGQQT